MTRKPDYARMERTILKQRVHIEALEKVAAYGEAVLRRDYEDEAGIESILSATRGIKSSHRSYEAFKAERLATLAAKEKKPRICDDIHCMDDKEHLSHE
jgi:hypothetical protein